MALAIDIMDGHDLRSTILVVQFIVRDAAALMAKLGIRWSASVYKGEWAYRTRSKAFKDKARLQLHSKNFGLKLLIVLNSFICKILYCFILKFKVTGYRKFVVTHQIFH